MQAQPRRGEVDAQKHDAKQHACRVTTSVLGGVFFEHANGIHGKS